MLFISRLSPALFLAHALAGLTFAFPARTLQPWQITTMNINGPESIGIPGANGSSPDNITLSFSFFHPNSDLNTTCAAMYLPANYPTALSQIHCLNSAVTFYFTPPYTYFGSNFTLDIEYVDSPAAVPTAYAGSVYLIDNNYTSPAHYLDCYPGAPYAGLSCTLYKAIPIPITSAM